MKLQKLFQEQRRLIEEFFERVDTTQAEKIFDVLNATKGMIFITGVGKSGLVAQKIATTMTSVNVRALYISPLDALHGDLGMLSEQDVFMLLSKSGESDELLQLIPYLNNKRVTLIAVTCDPGSHLGKLCDYEMVLPIEKELCHFGLMPTTSSAVQMLFGDILATALMQQRGLKIEEYRLNHPAGKIGRRMTLKVRDLMLHGEELPLARPDQMLIEVLVTLSEKRCGCMLVVDDSQSLLGILTDGDLRRALQKHGEKALQLPLEQLMTKTPRSTLPDLLAFDAMKAMEVNRLSPITVLPVLEEARVIGLIRMHDIIQSGV
ncbi:MAG: KpsF/GutQ family sugar-phosphate isomerase [Chlamydiia bacterium]|nr:KpsF/GutQ family sugar-phosphate isomerase [Chlamydiia bacterium]